ncbi:uncharacterized protein MEPE_05209 [Melanopsichium pennsylvanicum]|uniref:Uncharacterized protein n=1 Tax=Melanopsichium pennsylvanicum TaxID=63383 RepID=A0AAJ4XQ71_9BASI|nr:uncharacterized protein MEPE_05209 [Melanopsichium pennsylvanicum]
MLNPIASEAVASSSASSIPAPTNVTSTLPKPPEVSDWRNDSSPTPFSSRISPVTSTALRIQTLCYLLYGTSSTLAVSPRSVKEQQPPALIRLGTILSQLEGVKFSAGKPVKRLLDEWDKYADLLQPLAHDANGIIGRNDALWDIVQQSEHLLLMESELKQALKHLEQVESLVNQRHVLDVNSSKTLARASTESKLTRLEKVKENDEIQAQTTLQLQQRVFLLIQIWSEYTQTLSQTFTLLDNKILELESHLATILRTTTSSSSS